MMNNAHTIAAIILAAGQGKRMKASDINKVAMPLAGKPMVTYGVAFLETLPIKEIIVVVGFAKESVMRALSGHSVMFAEQTELLGTANAVEVALQKVSPDVTDVFIVQGDDSAFYAKETVMRLFNAHTASHAAFTFLTVEKENPAGLGRVVRDTSGKLERIVEEKDATDGQRQIKEINPACYIFSVTFLRKYLPMIEKSPVTGEYYLTSLIDIAIRNHEKIDAVQGGKIEWRGVNTPEELAAAEQALLKTK